MISFCGLGNMLLSLLHGKLLDKYGYQFSLYLFASFIFIG